MFRLDKKGFIPQASIPFPLAQLHKTPMIPSFGHLHRLIHVHEEAAPRHTISYRPRNAQLPYLPQHLLNLTVQMPLRVLLPRVGVQKLLHLRHPRIRLGAEPQLDLHEGLEAGIQVRHAQVDELREFGEELLVEGFVGGAREVGFAFGAGELRGVLVGFLDQFLDAGPGGVVVEEFVVAFLDACRKKIKSGTGCSRQVVEEEVVPTDIR